MSDIADRLRATGLEPALRQKGASMTADKLNRMLSFHDYILRAAKNGEEVPRYAILVSLPAEITDKEREWARAAVAETRRT